MGNSVHTGNVNSSPPFVTPNRIFVANGSEWKMHRHLAKPLFRTSSINNAMVPIFISHTDELLNEIEVAAKDKKPIEIAKVEIPLPFR